VPQARIAPCSPVIRLAIRIVVLRPDLRISGTLSQQHARKIGLDSGEVDGMMDWLLARKE
jgi:hypothetical protein